MTKFIMKFNLTDMDFAFNIVSGRDNVSLRIEAGCI